MKVKSLLAKAAKCKTQDDADTLLDTLVRAFGNTRPLAHLERCNTEAFMEEGDQPFICFELNHVISDHYITMIRPEIREGQLVIDVVTQHMRDGMGLSSHSWVAEEGMKETIEAEDDCTVADLARQAKELALTNHAHLLERLGVNFRDALDIAKKNW